MQDLREETTESNCGIASAVLVAELLEVQYSEADLAELRPRGGVLSFASLSSWALAAASNASDQAKADERNAARVRPLTPVYPPRDTSRAAVMNPPAF